MSLYSYWPEVVLTVPEWPWDAPSDCWLARSYPERPQGAQNCPNWCLIGYLDQAGASRGILKPIWHCWDHFRSLPIWLCPFQNPILVCKYLSPLISHRNGSVFKIYIYGSQFSEEEKNSLEICFLVPEILNKSYSCIFLNTLYICGKLWKLIQRIHQT